MRWILTAIAVAGILIAVGAHSPGLLAFGVLLALACGLAAALAFIDMHIQATSRSEYMTQGELDAIKASLKPASSDTDSSRLPPPASS